jgi:uncharacterized membrane protein YfcA
MDASEVIEAYIDDTVRLMPGRRRRDVATELRSLLNEKLTAQALATGRPPDRALALSVVRDCGHPNEFAAHYQPPVAIIDPADSTSFVRAAWIGVGALIVLNVIRNRLPSTQDITAYLLETGILSWLGFLLLAFATKSWLRRRWPTRPSASIWLPWPTMGATALWEPRDRDRVSRLGTALLVPIAAIFIAFYAAPTPVLERISRGRFDTSWSAYTPDFQSARLPALIALMCAQLVLLAFVAIQGRWRRLTRRIKIGLDLALACLILSFAAEGNIFQSSRADRVAINVLSVVAVIYVAIVGVQIYNEIGRIDRPPARKGE